MIKAKILTANSALELESSINEWARKARPHIVGSHYHADGVEYIYSALNLYQSRAVVRR